MYVILLLISVILRFVVRRMVLLRVLFGGITLFCRLTRVRVIVLTFRRTFVVLFRRSLVILSIRRIRVTRRIWVVFIVFRLFMFSLVGRRVGVGVRLRLTRLVIVVAVVVGVGGLGRKQDRKNSLRRCIGGPPPRRQPTMTACATPL